jgi:hypothetical protein
MLALSAGVELYYEGLKLTTFRYKNFKLTKLRNFRELRHTNQPHKYTFKSYGCTNKIIFAVIALCPNIGSPKVYLAVMFTYIYNFNL